MNDVVPDFPQYKDYRHDAELARYANAVLYPPERIQASILDPTRKDGLLPESASFISRADLAVLDRNATSGLVAMAFQDRRTGAITIAFRGIDNLRDVTGPTVALAADSDALAELVGSIDPTDIGIQGEGKEQLKSLQGVVVDSWHPQFADALDYVGRVRQAYPDARIEVTGVGVGGAMAEVAAHTYGLHGRAFDPLGARNIVESPEYLAYCKARGVTPEGVPTPTDHYSADGFASYAIKRSFYEGIGGDMLGQKRMVSPIAGREGADEHVEYAVGLLGDAIGEIKGLGMAGRAAKGVKNVGELLAASKVLESDRSEMDRLIRAFDIAARERHLPTWGSRGKVPAPGVAASEVSDPSARDRPGTSLRHPSDPAHPDHGMYTDIRTGLGTLVASQNRPWDERDEQAALALLVRAKEAGLGSADHIVPSRTTSMVAGGENLFVVQGRMDDPAGPLRAHVRTIDAIQTPESQSLDALERLNATLARQQSGPAQAQTLDAPERERGATLVRS